MRSARWAIRAVPVVTVLLGASGCGFMHALANPPSPGPEPVATATPALTPEPPPVVDGDLRTMGGNAAGRLVVTLGKARTGLVPPVHEASACHFDTSTLQYLPVQFASDAPGLAAHVEVRRGPDTPGDVGDVGIFMESNDGDQVYCADSPPLPTRDKFWNQSGAPTLTAWVVLEHAVTPATPDGRPEVFPTLQLRISRIRTLADPAGAGRSLVPGVLARGTVCPDDPAAICAPLG